MKKRIRNLLIIITLMIFGIKTFGELPIDYCQQQWINCQSIANNLLNTGQIDNAYWNYLCTGCDDAYWACKNNRS